MHDGPNTSSIAALFGDPARAAILTALMGGLALTATELALEAGVAPSTASSHLAQLVSAGLLAMSKQGRHRYFRLSGSDVADVLERLMGLAARTGQKRVRTGPADPALRVARVCYDHLAGDRGVRLMEGLKQRGLVLCAGESLRLSPDGEAFFRRFGVDVQALISERRPVCHACLDWSERRFHLAGALGAEILRQLMTRGWARRETQGRAVIFSKPGAAAFERWFALPGR